ncbi:hypothetical protein Gotur_034983, partial [Gossypium turneri]
MSMSLRKMSYRFYFCKTFSNSHQVTFSFFLSFFIPFSLLKQITRCCFVSLKSSSSQGLGLSHFGKFVEIQFNRRGRISGAAIKTYLLERSRVCQVSDPERNYHCFYMLCAAPPEVSSFL